MKKALKTVGLSVFTVLFLFHDVYNPLNNRYDAKTELIKPEISVKSRVSKILLKKLALEG